VSVSEAFKVGAARSAISPPRRGGRHEPLSTREVYL
jgi:hypothetical protein